MLTAEVRIELYDAIEYDKAIKGIEPLTSVVLTGDQWRDLEGGGRLETFFGLLRRAGETMVADEPFYLVAQIDQATMQMTHRRLVFDKASRDELLGEATAPGSARVALPVSSDRVREENGLLGTHIALLGNAGDSITTEGPYQDAEQATEWAQRTALGNWSDLVVRNPLVDELESAAQEVEVPQPRVVDVG